MAAHNREPSIKKTLTYEGGFTNDPRDPGGATNYGITIHDARLYWKPDATPEDVRGMPLSVAVDIYRQKYWAVMGCDDRPVGTDLVDFDLGVNSGVKRVLAWRPLFADLPPVDYVKAICAKRLSFLQSLKTFTAFGKGWSKRVADVEATGVRMALGASGHPVEPALRKEAANAAKKTIGHATGGASTTIATTSAAHEHVSTLWHGGEWTTKAGVCALGLGALIVIAAFVWHAVHNNHRANAYTAVAEGK